MELKTIYGDVIIALDTAKTALDLVLAAIAAKKSLSYADLRYADLSSADLSYANLRYADLRYADLSYADLRSADLSYADLSSADLSYANLRYAKNAELAIARIQFIPESGSFVGWKKCRDGVIVRILVGKTAKRSHGAERKCRASRVKVAEVFGAEFGVSLHDNNVLYRKGEIVEPLNGWGEDRWEVCAPGIHFYLTRIEAENHQ